MVAGLLPAAGGAGDLGVAEGRGQGRGEPDVVEAAAAIGGVPVAVAVAPPAEQLLVGRDDGADGVDPVVARLQAGELLDLDGRVADHLEQLLVAPDVGGQGRDVEIAQQDGAALVVALGREPVGQGVDHVELVAELGVLVRVRDVAAGRDVEVVQLDVAGQADDRVAALLDAAPADACGRR